MKVWRRYKDYLLSGEWHIHTNYTDGDNSVFEICKKAIELKIPLIAFTEHVRKDLSYDFNALLNDIEQARNEFPDVIILSGVEVKVLPNGDLDVDKSILRDVDYPIIAFHNFPANLELYINALKIALENKYVNGWAHPGLFLVRTNLTLPRTTIIEIFKIMEKNDILLEINSKYELPKKEWIELALEHGVQMVRGSDVHSVEMLKPYRGR